MKIVISKDGDEVTLGYSEHLSSDKEISSLRELLCTAITHLSNHNYAVKSNPDGSNNSFIEISTTTTALLIFMSSDLDSLPAIELISIVLNEFLPPAKL